MTDPAIRQQHGSDAHAAGETSLGAWIRKIVEDYLAHGTHGLAALETLVDEIETRIGESTDNGDLTTLFAKLKQLYIGVHAHILLVVADASSLNADTDTALQAELLDRGFQVVVADPTDIAGDLELAYDFIVVSGSITADTNLSNLREADCPVICHSAEVAVSTNVFSLGATAGTEAAQTQIEIITNTISWMITQATGDLSVTASATLETMASVSGDTTSLAEEATGTGNDITMARLKQGTDDGQGITAIFDRYFIGVKDFTNANSTFKTLMANLWEHVLHEVRFSEVLVTTKRVFEEQIPDTGFSLAAVDTALGSDPPSADAANSVVDLDKKTNRTFCLRSLWVNVSNLGTGTNTMTFQLWIDIGGTATSVDSKDVTATGYYSLMDLFGLQEVHADSIHVTAIVNATTGACAGIYRYAEAKK